MDDHDHVTGASNIKEPGVSYAGVSFIRSVRVTTSSNINQNLTGLGIAVLKQELKSRLPLRLSVQG